MKGTAALQFITNKSTCLTLANFYSSVSLFYKSKIINYLYIQLSKSKPITNGVKMIVFLFIPQRSSG